jgi:hypothetical protein
MSQPIVVLKFHPRLMRLNQVRLCRRTCEFGVSNFSLAEAKLPSHIGTSSSGTAIYVDDFPADASTITWFFFKISPTRAVLL